MVAPSSSDAPGPMLALRDIGMRFPDGTVALSEIDLEVPRGQFCVLLGASGAGKSTVLRILNGLARPTTGSVHVDGSPAPSRGVATIHQGVDLVLRSSVLQNVLNGALTELSTPRALLGWFGRERQVRACRLLHRVGITQGQLYRRAGELSGGQQQRVGIARAFMSDPALVLADEPVASLDPRTSREILALLQEAARERNATVLCSLHQVSLATQFADRIVGMRAGRIVFDRQPRTLDAGLLDDLYAAAA